MKMSALLLTVNQSLSQIKGALLGIGVNQILLLRIMGVKVPVNNQKG